MIYLTNDTCDQAVYFDLRKREQHRKAGATEILCYGLLGNGVSEISVMVRSWRDYVETTFGNGSLFHFVEEQTIRQILNKVVRDLAS